MDNAKPGRARRGDVLAEPERRRRWSLKEKLAIVAESFEDGAIVSQVAQRHGVRPQQLFGWRRQVREHVPRTVLPTGSPHLGVPAFAPVVIAEQPPPPVASAPSRAVSATTIEIAIGVATVRITGAVDAKALTAVLRALKAATP